MNIDDLSELACERCGATWDQHRIDGAVICERCLLPAEVSALYPPRTSGA